MKEYEFSLSDFKKWILSQRKADGPKSKLIGTYVESKLKSKRLLSRMSIDQGDVKEMAKDFKRYGGTVIDCENDGTLLIEVNSGTFRIPRYFVRI